MMFWIKYTGIFFFLILISTCSTMKVNKYTDYGCVIQLEPDDFSKDERAKRFIVELDAIEGEISDYDYGRLLVAGRLAHTVIKSERFRQEVLGYEHNGFAGFMRTDLTNSQVYDKIMNGSEEFHPVINYKMEMTLKTFEPGTRNKDDQRVIAFVRGRGKYVYFSTKYLHYNAIKKADTLVHEWLHLLGFDHEEEDTETRGYTVPYAVGTIVQDIAMDYYKQECWWK